MPSGKPVSAELRKMISDKVDSGSSNEDIWRDLFPMGTNLLTRRTLQRYAKICRSGTIGQKIIFLNGANLVKTGRPRIIDRLAERILSYHMMVITMVDGNHDQVHVQENLD